MWAGPHSAGPVPIWPWTGGLGVGRGAGTQTRGAQGGLQPSAWPPHAHMAPPQTCRSTRRVPTHWSEGDPRPAGQRGVGLAFTGRALSLTRVSHHGGICTGEIRCTEARHQPGHVGRAGASSVAAELLWTRGSLSPSLALGLSALFGGGTWMGPCGDVSRQGGLWEPGPQVPRAAPLPWPEEAAPCQRPQQPLQGAHAWPALLRLTHREPAFHTQKRPRCPVCVPPTQPKEQ